MRVDPTAHGFVDTDYAKMLEALDICVLVHDAETLNILWANRAACEMLEFNLDELLPLKAHQMSDLVREYSRRTGRAWLKEAVKRGASRTEWHYRSKSGRIIPTDALATRVELARGAVVLVQFRDITHEQQVERELQAKRDLEMYRENYLSRYNAMGDMAMSIAHELRQPLAAASNFIAGAQTRLSGVSDETVRFGLDSARRQIDRISEIVNSVRAFVGHLDSAVDSVDLNDILSECAYFVELRAKSAEVSVEWIPSTQPVIVRAERVLVGQVLLNLCYNAIDEMSLHPSDLCEISVSIEDDGKSGRVVVSDRGRGLTADPFAMPFTSKPAGAGIGLELCRRIIDRHEGELWWEPRQGGGTTFSFTLPLEQTREIL